MLLSERSSPTAGLHDAKLYSQVTMLTTAAPNVGPVSQPVTALATLLPVMAGPNHAPHSVCKSYVAQ